MRLAILPMLVLLLSPTPAAAVSGVLGREADAKTCFDRSYSDAHLAKNPAQTITRIRISVSRESIPGSVGVPPADFLRIELTRRGDAQVRRAIGWCDQAFGGKKASAKKSAAAGARCRITSENHMSAEEDSSGGEVDIRPANGGLLARLPDAIRLRTGPKVSVDKGQMVRLGASDLTFRLTKINAAACDDLRNAIREE